MSLPKGTPSYFCLAPINGLGALLGTLSLRHHSMYMSTEYKIYYTYLLLVFIYIYTCILNKEEKLRVYVYIYYINKIVFPCSHPLKPFCFPGVRGQPHAQAVREDAAHVPKGFCSLAGLWWAFSIYMYSTYIYFLHTTSSL